MAAREEHGKDLEPPSLQNLVRLREDTEELNQRIQLVPRLGPISHESQGRRIGSEGLRRFPRPSGGAKSLVKDASGLREADRFTARGCWARCGDAGAAQGQRRWLGPARLEKLVSIMDPTKVQRVDSADLARIGAKTWCPKRIGEGSRSRRRGGLGVSSLTARKACQEEVGASGSCRSPLGM